LRVALTPALSRKRERGRAVAAADDRGYSTFGDRGRNPFSRLREKVAAKRPDEGLAVTGTDEAHRPHRPSQTIR